MVIHRLALSQNEAPMTDAPPTADAAAEGQLDLSQIRVETLMLQPEILEDLHAKKLKIVYTALHGAGGEWRVDKQRLRVT